MTSTLTFRLLDLPAELQNAIYKHLWAGYSPMTMLYRPPYTGANTVPHLAFYETPCLATESADLRQTYRGLSGANKQLRRESNPIFFDQTTSRFVIPAHRTEEEPKRLSAARDSALFSQMRNFSFGLQGRTGEGGVNVRLVRKEKVEQGGSGLGFEVTQDPLDPENRSYVSLL
ncbi:hypothetical protein LTR36_004868 [Oleoguttula mirabilis]|uniref:Uncharacterized protein n=1 Tax=Oleoguttula mirabilis TaxID=1507867 RepID=A0AAV9JF53_9PEZI|nr:hypothetical protein LTR36_004868 [Oleoguttula mirabilis]